MVPRNLKIKTVDTIAFDPIIAEKIDLLQGQKKAALEVEDFDYCKQIKQFVDKLKIVGNQVINMTQEKDLAIENEDYDIAKQLKYQIEQLKEAALNMGMNSEQPSF